MTPPHAPRPPVTHPADSTPTPQLYLSALGFVTQQPISVIMPSHLMTPGDTITWRRAFPSAITCTRNASYVGKAHRQGGLAASSLAASLASPGSQIGIALQTLFPGTPSADSAHCCAIPYRSGNGHPNPNPQSFPPGTSRITNARSQHQVADWHIPCLGISRSPCDCSSSRCCGATANN